MIGIPLAAGAFIHLFGWQLNPMFGAAAMSLSSFCVVSNALRLNLFKLHDGKGDHPLHPVDDAAFMQAVADIQHTMKEERTMTKTVKINGMMCPHCEARVKKALEAIDGVQSAAPSHENNNAVLELTGDFNEAAVKAAVVDAGYEYLGAE